MKAIAGSRARGDLSWAGNTDHREAGDCRVPDRYRYALYAPAGVPSAVTHKLRSTANAALQSPSLREKFSQQGAEPTDPSPARLEKLMREDYARWSKLVIDAKLRID